MASSTPVLSIQSVEASKDHAYDISSIKSFVESNGLSTIPSNYHSLIDPLDREVADELGAFIPVIDFSFLTSDDPQFHGKVVQELGRACEEWGFFMVKNHGIQESLIEDVMKMSHKFHDMPVEEKSEFADKGVSTPIRCGTSFSPKVESVHYWRDYLKVMTHPEFNFPHKPAGYKELAFEYSGKTRAVVRKLLEGIAESLGLQPNAIIESTGFDSGLQIFAVNLYPPCPQPDLALGMPPHSDHGLLTLLTQNGIGGLQVNHKGKWVNVNPLPHTLIVNTGDQLEVVSNGRYRSVLHRAMLNNKDTRISLVTVNGPAFEKVIGPAPELLEKEEPFFRSMNYKEYFEIQQKTSFADKSGMNQIRINAQN